MKALVEYAVTRIALTIPLLPVLPTLVFVVLRVMPGDPVASMLGAHAPPDVIEEKREELYVEAALAVGVPRRISNSERAEPLVSWVRATAASLHSDSRFNGSYGRPAGSPEGESRTRDATS